MSTDITHNDKYFGKKYGAVSCFEIDQEMDAILLIIGIVYGVYRIVIKSVQQCTYFLFSSPYATDLTSDR
jgi:hypothetical protein